MVHRERKEGKGLRSDGHCSCHNNDYGPEANPYIGMSDLVDSDDEEAPSPPRELRDSHAEAVQSAEQRARERAAARRIAAAGEGAQGGRLGAAERIAGGVVAWVGGGGESSAAA